MNAECYYCQKEKQINETNEYLRTKSREKTNMKIDIK